MKKIVTVGLCHGLGEKTAYYLTCGSKPPLSKRASCHKDYTWLVAPHWTCVVGLSSHTRGVIYIL